MSKLIDTNIALFLANGFDEVTSRVAAFDDRPCISLITLVELEGGVFAGVEAAARRRERLDILLELNSTGLNRLGFTRGWFSDS